MYMNYTNFVLICGNICFESMHFGIFLSYWNFFQNKFGPVGLNDLIVKSLSH